MERELNHRKRAGVERQRGSRKGEGVQIPNQAVLGNRLFKKTNMKAHERERESEVRINTKRKRSNDEGQRTVIPIWLYFLSILGVFTTNFANQFPSSMFSIKVPTSKGNDEDIGEVEEDERRGFPTNNLTIVNDVENKGNGKGKEANIT